MLLRNIFPTLLAAYAAVAAPQASSQTAAHFDWQNTRLRGVNLGGWLVLEPWITPTLFNEVPGQTAVDEYTLCEYYGKAQCHSILEQHWSTWITQADINQVKAWGFNMVRIPIGYWAFEEFTAATTPFVHGADAYLDLALEWAREAGLYVLIDLHGAPMSQNGFDNSGERLTTPGWGQGSSVQDTLDVINLIAQKYAQPEYNDVVLGIELLNEPLNGAGDVTVDLIQSYYNSGWNIVRGISAKKVVVLHDAFLPVSNWNDFLFPSTSTRVSMDHHEYQCFDDYHVALNAEQHRAAVCSQAPTNYGNHKGHWAFVGEWSAAMTDCATWLNGYHVGARYDGTYPGSTYVGSCAGKEDVSTWSQEVIDNHRWYIETQMDAFDHYTRGWIFWTLKTRGSGEWDLYRLMSVGAFPQPLDARNFPPACGYGDS